MSSTVARFADDELARVLADYDIGQLISTHVVNRGSRRAAKLVVETSNGRYLLKRRAHGRDDPERAAFSHQLSAHLRAQRFPVPQAIAATDGASLRLINEQLYEMFEFLPGKRFENSLEESANAGKTLARFHLAVADFPCPDFPYRGYHDSPRVRTGFDAIPSSTSSHDSVVGREAELLANIQFLYEQYDRAAAAVNELGLPGWPRQVIHGDWHPGNLLFARRRVAAVVDFDSARLDSVLMDVANGMLQFSILRGGADPQEWPEYFDQPSMRRFFAGYLARSPLAAPQRRALLPLMIESLIAECTVPVAATGSLGPAPGFTVLQMARRKVAWLLSREQDIHGWLIE